MHNWQKAPLKPMRESLVELVVEVMCIKGSYQGNPCIDTYLCHWLTNALQLVIVISMQKRASLFTHCLIDYCISVWKQLHVPSCNCKE